MSRKNHERRSIVVVHLVKSYVVLQIEVAPLHRKIYLQSLSSARSTSKSIFVERSARYRRGTFQCDFVEASFVYPGVSCRLTGSDDRIAIERDSRAS